MNQNINAKNNIPFKKIILFRSSFFYENTILIIKEVLKQSNLFDSEKNSKTELFFLYYFFQYFSEKSCNYKSEISPQ